MLQPGSRSPGCVAIWVAVVATLCTPLTRGQLVNPLSPDLTLGVQPAAWLGDLESPSPYFSCPDPPRVLVNVNGICERGGGPPLNRVPTVGWEF